jgi:hypothetical protein
VKISLFVEHSSLNRSAVVSRQASQQASQQASRQASQQPRYALSQRDDDNDDAGGGGDDDHDDAGNGDDGEQRGGKVAQPDALVRQICTSLVELALVTNNGAEFAIDCLDMDFCKQHNMITSTQSLAIFHCFADDNGGGDNWTDGRDLAAERPVFIDFGNNIVPTMQKL